MDGYDRGGHTKYSLKAHLIFVTKYRKHTFTRKMHAECVKQFLYDAEKQYGCQIIQMETDKDHVHILLGYQPDKSVSNIVKYLKQYSTYQMWERNESFMSKQYWKRKILWSEGYFACSIGQVSQGVIEKYIQNQG